MGKFTTYVLIMTGLLLIFHLFGVIEQGTTPNSQLLQILIEPENLSFGSFFQDYIVLTLTTGAGLAAGIVLGFITKNAELTVMISLATYLGTVLWDFLAVYQSIASQNEVLALIFFAPLMFLFGITLVDWWRGRD